MSHEPYGIRMRRLGRVALLSLTMCAAFLGVTASPAQAVFYQVPNYAADSFNTDGRCSLREALRAIKDRVVVDTCPAGDAFWNEIQITGDPARALQLTISDPIEIKSYVSIYANYGPGFYQAIKGGYAQFVVLPGGQLELSGLKITAFKVAPFNVKAGFIQGQGFVRGRLYFGGGELSFNNPAGGLDQTAGIMNDGGDVSLSNLSIHHNTGAIKGGAVYNKGLLTMNNVSMYANEVSQYGGAIHSVGGTTVKTTLFNCTISGNKAGIAGGGIYNGEGTTDLSWTTITKNRAENLEGAGVLGGAGVYVVSGTLITRRTIISDNVTSGYLADDCTGKVTSTGYNLLQKCPGATSGTGDVRNVSAQLSALTFPSTDQWTLTPYHMPNSNSPAFNAIPNGVCIPGPDDQINRRRPATTGTACDIGSIERQ